jgi:hypothetical protein
MPEGDTIEYTGWTMTADVLRRHSRSEAALHRWDLVGDDSTSIRLLSDPQLTQHAMSAFANMPILLEAQRWIDATFTSRPVRLRSDADQPDILVTPGEGLTMVGRDDGPGVVLTMHPWERLQLLWGRVPARFRDPQANAETVDDVLQRLIEDPDGAPSSMRDADTDLLN